MGSRSTSDGSTVLESAEEWRHPQKALFKIYSSAGCTGISKRKHYVLHLLHSFTVCVLEFTVCFNLGLQNFLANRGNAFGLVCPTAWANYLTSVKQSKVVLLYWGVHLASCTRAPLVGTGTFFLSPPLPSRFCIVASVLHIEEGSVSCSFAILVALGLNLIFFFPTSIFGSAFFALQLF